MMLKVLSTILISFIGVVIVSWGDFNLTDLTVMIGNVLSLLSVISIVFKRNIYSVLPNDRKECNAQTHTLGL